MNWVFTLLGIAFVLGGLLLLVRVHQQLERRADAIDQELAELRDRDAQGRAALAENLRRLTLVVDNQGRQLKALAADVGWCDDRAHTKVITSPDLPRTEGR